MPILLPVKLSPSRTELGARCWRRHFLSDVCDRVPENDDGKPSADFGTVMHKGVAQWWMGLVEARPARSRFREAHDVLVEKWNELRPWGDRHTFQMAEALFTYYSQKMKLAGSLGGEWEVAVIDGVPMIEQRRLVIIGNAELSFQIDRLLKKKGKNEYALIDLKTAAKLAQYWHDQFDLWLQGKLYSYSLHNSVLGKVPEHLIVEGLEKSVPVKHAYHPCPFWDDEQLNEAFQLWERIAAKDARVLQEALYRVTGMPSKMSEEEFQLQWRQVAEEIALVEPDFNYGDCRAYNQPCQYRGLCTRPCSQRYSLLRSDYVVQPTEGY